eukprot:1177912-Prorocentrum_minimum.AAC.5
MYVADRRPGRWQTANQNTLDAQIATVNRLQRRPAITSAVTPDGTLLACMSASVSLMALLRIPRIRIVKASDYNRPSNIRNRLVLPYFAEGVTAITSPSTLHGTVSLGQAEDPDVSRRTTYIHHANPRERPKSALPSRTSTQSLKAHPHFTHRYAVEETFNVLGGDAHASAHNPRPASARTRPASATTHSAAFRPASARAPPPASQLVDPRTSTRPSSATPQQNRHEWETRILRQEQQAAASVRAARPYARPASAVAPRSTTMVASSTTRPLSASTTTNNTNNITNNTTTRPASATTRPSSARAILRNLSEGGFGGGSDTQVPAQGVGRREGLINCSSIAVHRLLFVYCNSSLRTSGCTLQLQG